MTSLWRRNTTDTPTLHRINNVSVNSLRVSETFQRCLSSAVTENWPPLKFTGENELTNSLVKKIGIHLTDTPVVSILLFPRAAIKQFINWPMNRMFWIRSEFAFFFLHANQGWTKFLKHLARISWGLTRLFSSASAAWINKYQGLSKTRQAKRHSPSSKIIFQRINVASVRKRTSFFITVIKAQWYTLTGTCGIKPLIMTGWA